jgi:hypothetical protein
MKAKMPKKVEIRLGPARRRYIERLLAGGLHGNTAEEVVETLFCRGLQECVPAEWMREAGDDAQQYRDQCGG